MASNYDPLAWGSEDQVMTAPTPNVHYQDNHLEGSQLIDLDLGSPEPPPAAPAPPSPPTAPKLYPTLPTSTPILVPPPIPAFMHHPTSPDGGPAFGTSDTSQTPMTTVNYNATVDTDPPPWSSPGYSSFPPTTDHNPTSSRGTFAGYSNGVHASDGQRLVVVVGTPVKVTGGSTIPGVDGGHWEFPLTTHTSLPSWPTPQIQVMRRFRDFVALSELLTHSLPGYFLPQRPHRNAMQSRRASPRFLDQRRVSLERYMARLTNHPVVRTSAPLQVFLQASGELRLSPAWAALQPPSAPGLITSTTRFFKQVVGKESSTPNARDVTRSARASGDVMRLLREQMAAMQGLNKGAPLTPLENELRDSTTRMDETRKALSSLSTAATVLVEKALAAGQASQDMAKALRTLARFEQEYGYSTGRNESCAAEALSRTAEVGLLCNEHVAQQLTLVHEQLEAIPVAQIALGTRERALLTSLTLEVDLSKRRRSLSGAQAMGPAGFEKAQGLGEACNDLQVVLNAARDEYDRLAERNSQEIVVWRRGMQRELSAMVQDLAFVQVTANERAEQLWKEAALVLEGPKPVQGTALRML